MDPLNVMDELDALKRRVGRLQGAVLVLCALLFSTAGVALANLSLIRTARLAHTRWSGDTLSYSSLTGRVLITGLAQGGVAAKLPEPILTVDSESVSWDMAELRKLKWRNEGGGEEAPPEPGTPVEALFIQMESSKFKP